MAYPLLKRSLFFLKRIKMKFNFSSKDYWELRYSTAGNSGHGSYGKFAEDKSNYINKLIKDYDLKSCIEYGCGDGNNLKYYNFEKYLGLDVAETSIQLCIAQYKNDPSKSFAFYKDGLFHNVGNFFTADVTLSSEVLFHLVEEEVFKTYLRNLFQSAKKGVIIISTDHNDNHDSPMHIVHRNFSDFVTEEFPEWKRVSLDPNDEYVDYFHYYTLA